MALLFYAGHGMQVGGKNYLVPVDAKLDRVGNLSFETIEAGQILALMEAERQARVQAIKGPEVPADLIGTMSFLTNDDAAFVTGQTLNVDCGRVRS